ncbi:arrestin domain-containing protein 4 isoform X1 [Tenrec ecaudatus]|uniref:arrestin domain-containing protein 4 isoform X1 n=1 Tax=Tenrec ecaudatus TaxID=94439 RepID=UPI003F59EDFB
MGGEAGSAAALVAEGRVKSLGLVFEDESKGYYSSGETVAGHVLLEAAEPVTLRALRLEAQGRATIAWGPGPGSRGLVSAPAPAAASEVEYLNLRLSLREPQAGEGIVLLPPGKHEFPFRFQLPTEPLVTSFTGKYGSIQYCVKAVLERPAVPDQSVKRELQVVSHIDVNTPALLTPVLKTREKMVGCWIFTSGPVSLSAKIERKGYCNGRAHQPLLRRRKRASCCSKGRGLGNPMVRSPAAFHGLQCPVSQSDVTVDIREAIPIYAEIENCSSHLVVPKAAIFQTQTYLGSGKTKTVRHMVINVRGNFIAPGITDTWNGKILEIPPVTPSILDCCVIRVDYSLAVYIDIPGAKKLMLELPLVIGTVPYSGFGSRNSSVASQFSVDMSWLALTLPEQPEAPPNYADVVSEEECARHSHSYSRLPRCEGEASHCPRFACIQEFQFQPPPLYSEIDPHPSDAEENQAVSFIL